MNVNNKGSDQSSDQPVHRHTMIRAFSVCCLEGILAIHIMTSARVNVLIISKYATKIVGTQNKQEACVQWTQDQKQSTISKFKPAQ